MGAFNVSLCFCSLSETTMSINYLHDTQVFLTFEMLFKNFFILFFIEPVRLLWTRFEHFRIISRITRGNCATVSGSKVSQKDETGLTSSLPIFRPLWWLLVVYWRTSLSRQNCFKSSNLKCSGTKCWYYRVMSGDKTWDIRLQQKSNQKIKMGNANLVSSRNG